MPAVCRRSRIVRVLGLTLAEAETHQRLFIGGHFTLSWSTATRDRNHVQRGGRFDRPSRARERRGIFPRRSADMGVDVLGQRARPGPGRRTGRDRHRRRNACCRRSRCRPRRRRSSRRRNTRPRRAATPSTRPTAPGRSRVERPPSTLTTPCAWSASSDAAWARIDSSTGLGTTTFTLTVDPNPLAENRIGHAGHRRTGRHRHTGGRRLGRPIRLHRHAGRQRHQRRRGARRHRLGPR